MLRNFVKEPGRLYSMLLPALQNRLLLKVFMADGSIQQHKTNKIKTTKIFIHGFLHLIVFDHINTKDYKKMFDYEKKIFKSVEKLLN